MENLTLAVREIEQAGHHIFCFDSSFHNRKLAELFLSTAIHFQRASDIKTNLKYKNRTLEVALALAIISPLFNGVHPTSINKFDSSL